MAGIIVLIGPTGAGKSIQADRLAAARGWVHLSTGALLRQDPLAAAGLVSGRLAAPAEVERVLTAAVTAAPSARTIVLDGFPRTLSQAQWLRRQLPGWSRQLTHVLALDIDEATSRDRLSRRGRTDDTASAQRRKWLDYATTTEPVISYYRRHGQLTLVDGRGSIEDVSQNLQALLS